MKIPALKRVAWIKFHIEDPKILGATVRNLVATATQRPGFVHPWFISYGAFCLLQLEFFAQLPVCQTKPLGSYNESQQDALFLIFIW
jgi:hypothetical protein